MNEKYMDIRCTNCSSSLLDRIGTELYCLECETVNNQFQFEMQVVPAGYQSNSRNRRELDLERKLGVHIRQFVYKYGLLNQEHEINNLRDKLMRMKKAAPNAKGTREAAAVVVYSNLKQEIKLSIFDFCKQNNLRQKTFNQKYKVYHKLYYGVKEITPEICNEEKESNQFIKMEEKVDDSHLTSKSDSAVENEEISEKGCAVGEAESRKAIEVVFDKLFPNFYLKEKKQLIIHKLITKVTTIPSEVFLKMEIKPSSQSLSLYCIIFAIIKELGYKIGFERFRDIIKGRTGYVLKKGQTIEVKKHYDQFCLAQKESLCESVEIISVNGIKIEDNNPVPRIKFPVADSQNQFSYQYYFDDYQFYE